MASSDALLKSDRADAWADLRDRRIKEKTLRRYGYFRGTFAGKSGPVGVHVAPYYDQAGRLVAQKLRTPDKDFIVLKEDGAPGLRECRLFGQQVFGDGNDKRVVITEGELDAMSVAQVMDFKMPVVSVNTGAEAVKNIQANYRWLDRFAEVILFFDADEPGRKASEAVAKLFAVGKVKIARISDFKDASAALQDNRPGDIEAAIWSATAWRPEGIVNAADCIADVAEPDNELPAYSYPWTGLQAMTHGMRAGEVIYHVAGTGIGKTTFLREIEYQVLFKQSEPVKIGYMGFEDMRREVQLALIGVHASRRLNVDPLPPEERARLHHEVFGSRLVELFDPETAEWDVEAILGYIRYMAAALECKVIFIDPLSFIIAGLGSKEDERRALDRVSMQLAKLAKELAVTLHITHHLKRSDGVAHEEGGEISLNEVRGSGGIAQFASFVIGWERDQQGEHKELTRCRILKNRPFGENTGVAMILKYDTTTGRVHETSEPWPERRKTERSRGQGRGGFSDDPAAFGKEY